MNKYLIIIIAIVIFLSGLFTGFKLQKQPIINIPACPECPSIEVQSLNLDNIKKIKGDFTFAPQYSGTITIKQDK